MNWRLIAALAAGLAVASCGGNPFTDNTDTGGEDGGGEDGGGTTPPPVAPANSVTQGDISSIAYTPGASTLQISLRAQDAPVVTEQYARNASFDVPGYEAYTKQETTSNRHVVALVRQVGDVSGVIAMDAGQFVNYYAAGTAIRADTFTFNAGTVSETQGAGASYSGTYVGMLNVGRQAPGGPGGDLNPEVAYRTQGRTLITADFNEMNVTGGVDNRVIVDPAAAGPGIFEGRDLTADGLVTLPTIGLFESTISPEGTFAGNVRIGTTDVGTYTGIFGERADAISTVMVFQPIPVPNLEERGLAVLPSCTTGGGPACP